MQSKIINKLAIIYFVFLACSVGAQDPFFSTITMDDLYHNPAHVISIDDDNTKGKVGLTFRDQWGNLGGGSTFTTFKIESDYTIYKSTIDAWNIGLLLLSDRSNGSAFKYTAVTTHAAYTRNIGRTGMAGLHTITIGVSGSYNQTNLGIDNLWFGRQYDVSALAIDPGRSNGEPLLRESNSYFDINLGGRWKYLLSKTTSIYSSAAIHHLNSRPVGHVSEDITQSSRLFLSGGIRTNINKRVSHAVSLSYLGQSPSWQVMPQYQAHLAMLDNDNEVTMGLSSRIANQSDGIVWDAIIFNFGIRAATWDAAFSYDMNVSELSTQSGRPSAYQLRLNYLITDQY